MSETIHDGKFVELTYKVTDRKSGHVLTCVEFPLGYVHGHNEILAPSVHNSFIRESSSADRARMRFAYSSAMAPATVRLIRPCARSKRRVSNCSSNCLI